MDNSTLTVAKPPPLHPQNLTAKREKRKKCNSDHRMIRLRHKLQAVEGVENSPHDTTRISHIQVGLCNNMPTYIYNISRDHQQILCSLFNLPVNNPSTRPLAAGRLGGTAHKPPSLSNVNQSQGYQYVGRGAAFIAPAYPHSISQSGVLNRIRSDTSNSIHTSNQRARREPPRVIFYE